MDKTLYNIRSFSVSFSQWVRTTVQSVGGLGLVMNKYGGGGGVGTDSKRNSKVVYFYPYRPSLMDN